MSCSGILALPLFRYLAFAAAHTLSHPVIHTTKRLMSTGWVWAGMAANKAQWCQDCQHCQQAKVTKQQRAAVQHIPIPIRRFSHVHIDLVGPLPRSPEGFNHIFTLVDHSSRWLEAIPLPSTDMVTIAAAFTSNWVAHFGVPDHLTTDCGPQFCSALWSELLRRWGINHHLTTAHHPQASGMVERAHRQLKDALQAQTAGSDWASHLYPEPRTQLYEIRIYLHHSALRALTAGRSRPTNPQQLWGRSA